MQHRLEYIIPKSTFFQTEQRKYSMMLNVLLADCVISPLIWFLLYTLVYLCHCQPKEKASWAARLANINDLYDLWQLPFRSNEQYMRTKKIKIRGKTKRFPIPWVFTGCSLMLTQGKQNFKEVLCFFFE